MKDHQWLALEKDCLYLSCQTFFLDVPGHVFLHNEYSFLMSDNNDLWQYGHQVSLVLKERSEHLKFIFRWIVIGSTLSTQHTFI